MFPHKFSCQSWNGIQDELTEILIVKITTLHGMPTQNISISCLRNKELHQLNKNKQSNNNYN